MSAPNDGGPAFPVVQTQEHWVRDNEDKFQVIGLVESTGGMTLRDYFAAKAMQGALSGHHAHAGHEDYWPPAGVASYAYEMADAMLAARKVRS